VSFCSLEAEPLSFAFQAPRWMGKGVVRWRWEMEGTAWMGGGRGEGGFLPAAGCPTRKR
jgi:hypothetical protein